MDEQERQRIEQWMTQVREAADCDEAGVAAVQVVDFIDGLPVSVSDAVVALAIVAADLLADFTEVYPTDVVAAGFAVMVRRALQQAMTMPMPSLEVH